MFGGDTLKDFAFALLVGIGSGAYSSIFIAAPLLAWFKEREPEYARRKNEDSLEGIESVGGALLDETPVAAPEVPSAPVPVPSPATAGVPSPAAAEKRERRRQRRSGRPHGRSR